MKGYNSLEKSDDKDIKDFLKTLEKLTRKDKDFKTKYKTLKQDANTIDEFYEGVRGILDIEPVSKKQRDRPLKKGTPTWREFIRQETKERTATISYHKSAKSKLKPRILKERKVDFKGKFLTKLVIRTKNVGNLEDLFDLIKEYVSNNEDVESIMILFKLRGRNKVRGMTLQRELFENSFEEFEAKYDSNVSGSSGSDAYNIGTNDTDLEIILSEFVALKKNLSTYGGDSKYLLFKTIGIDGSKNECGINCIKKLGYGELLNEYNKNRNPKNNLRTITEMCNFIRENKLPINVCNNTIENFEVIEDANRVFKAYFKHYVSNGKGGFKVKISKKTGEIVYEDINVVKLRMADIIPNKFNLVSKDNIATIICDFEGKHFDILENNVMTLRDNLYLKVRICKGKIYSGNCIYVKLNDEKKIVEDFVGKKVEINGDYDMIFDCGRLLKNKTIKENKIIEDNIKINIIEETKEETEQEETKEENIIFKSAFPTYRKKYLFFDYETIICFKENSFMKPYSLSLLCLDDNTLKMLNKYDAENNKDEVDKIRKENCITFLGYDSGEKFVKWIYDNQGGNQFIFIGFNSANFDNFILYNSLLNFYVNDEIEIRNEQYNGNQLLNFVFAGRHICFDLHKHLAVGGLDSNCKGFKVNCCAKKPFNHDYAQSLHKEGKLIEYINNDPKLKEYNEYDVLATAVLFERYRDCLREIKSTEKYADCLEQTTTIGSMIYKVFSEHSKTQVKNAIVNYEEVKIEDKKPKKGRKPKDIKEIATKPNEKNKKIKTQNKTIRMERLLGSLEYHHYKDILKYKVAGRVELFNDILKIMERMGSSDVCSLYPYVMAVLNVYYPAGNVVEVDDYKGDDVLGFYYCNVKQHNLKARNLPKIYPRKTELENIWDNEDELKGYLLSNVMIGLLREYGCEVEILPYIEDPLYKKDILDESGNKISEELIKKKSFVFSHKIRGCDLFEFILEMMMAKNKQDDLKQNKNDLYNSALRETLKLLMNSLSGKVIEGLHIDQIEAINTEAQFNNFIVKHNNYNFINIIGEKIFVSYKKDEEEECLKKQRPIYLGVYIYDYAKRYMYQYSYSKIGLDKLVYTDTDASKMRYKDFEVWKKWVRDNNVKVPAWDKAKQYDNRYGEHLIYEENSKVFGSFEDELEEMYGDSYVFYCLQKKSWCYECLPYRYDKEGKNLCSKFKFKGINGRALMVNKKDTTIVAEKITKKRDGGEIITLAIRDINDDGYELDESEIDEKTYEWAVANADERKIENGNVVKFFENLYINREGYVLANSFRKCVKNTMRNVSIDDTDKYSDKCNNIIVRYALKKITILDAQQQKEKREAK
jgi:hypothetical protein